VRRSASISASLALDEITTASISAIDGDGFINARNANDTVTAG
jgi:hypothetical protein